MFNGAGRATLERIEKGAEELIDGVIETSDGTTLGYVKELDLSIQSTSARHKPHTLVCGGTSCF